MSYSSCKSEPSVLSIFLTVTSNILPLIFSYYQYESIAKLIQRHGISPNSIQALFEYSLCNTKSSESQNFYINIPDRPFMLILFQESELKLLWNEIWNSLPLHIRETENLHNFKNKLKTHLFKEAFPKEQ